jgi:hypothetical protein
MAPIVTSIEIDRPQDDVFAYVTDPTRFAEWQAGVEGGSTEGGTSPSVGSKCTTTRRVGGTARQVTSEITKIDPTACGRRSAAATSLSDLGDHARGARTGARMWLSAPPEDHSGATSGSHR